MFCNIINVTHFSTPPTLAHHPFHPRWHAAHTSMPPTQACDLTSPTLTRHPRKHATHATHASTNSTLFLNSLCLYFHFFDANRYSTVSLRNDVFKKHCLNPVIVQSKRATKIFYLQLYSTLTFVFVC